MPTSFWTPEVIVVLLLLVAIGGVVGFLFATTRKEKQVRAADLRWQDLQVTVATLQAQLQAAEDKVLAAQKEWQTAVREHKEECNAWQTKLEQANQQIYTIEKRSAELKAQQLEREASHAREMATFEQQKNNLTEHFKVLSNEIL